jgi:cob(I)alamin adenosyltransferase
VTPRPPHCVERVWPRTNERPVTRIYTRTGDGGETSLFGGERVSKDALRVCAYGTVDELNAVIGLARSTEMPQEIDGVLERLQHQLFDLGAELATPDAASRAAGHVMRTPAARVAALEGEIDRFEAMLPALREFVLPGGTPAAAALHHARTVARRAEREIVRLAGQEPVNPELLKYVNRLSDLLFVLARAANHMSGRPDVTWIASR